MKNKTKCSNNVFAKIIFFTMAFIASGMYGVKARYWDDFLAAKRSFEQKPSGETADALWQAYDDLTAAKSRDVGPYWRTTSRSIMDDFVAQSIFEENRYLPFMQQGHRTRFGLSAADWQQEQDRCNDRIFEAEQQRDEALEKCAGSHERIAELEQALQACEQRARQEKEDLERSLFLAHKHIAEKNTKIEELELLKKF